MNPVLVEQMAMYAAYHRDRRNKATHFVGVPVIVLSLLVPMAWARIEVGGTPVSLALAFTLAMLAIYLWLDRAVGFATAAAVLPLLALAEWIAGLGYQIGGTVAAVLFVGGWILQLVGHVFEGRKPALADNLLQVFIAPIFLAAEVLFAVGLKRELAAAVHERRTRHLPRRAAHA
jgi:uncharacterized membrane protein YGL010W